MCIFSYRSSIAEPLRKNRAVGLQSSCTSKVVVTIDHSGKGGGGDHLMRMLITHSLHHRTSPKAVDPEVYCQIACGLEIWLTAPTPTALELGN